MKGNVLPFSDFLYSNRKKINWFDSFWEMRIYETTKCSIFRFRQMWSLSLNFGFSLQVLVKFICHKLTTQIYLYYLFISTRVFHENMFFMKKIGSTRSASILKLVWRNPKGFLILTSFWGCTSHFRFDLFYIVDFHSVLTSQVSVQKS